MPDARPMKPAADPGRGPSLGRVAGPVVVSMALAAGLLAGPALGPQDSETAAGEDEPQIRFRVTGLRSDDGKLDCGLFVEENWLRAGAVDGEGGEIEDGEAVCRFRGVAPGTWAISSYHDENDNGRLDTGFMRIPKEGTAASNNAYRRFGPPRYRDAKFEYRGGVLELEAEIRYIGGRKAE